MLYTIGEFILLSRIGLFYWLFFIKIRQKKVINSPKNLYFHPKNIILKTQKNCPFTPIKFFFHIGVKVLFYWGKNLDPLDAYTIYPILFILNYFNYFS